MMPPTEAETASQIQNDDSITVKLCMMATSDEDTKATHERYAHVQSVIEDLPEEITRNQRHVRSYILLCCVHHVEIRCGKRSTHRSNKQSILY